MKENVFVQRSFQQRVTILDGQTINAMSPYSPRLLRLWRRVVHQSVGYEANHGADGNKYFIASKTYHLPIERMNYSV